MVDAEGFKQKITQYDIELEAAINEGKAVTTLSQEYQSNVKALICESLNSNFLDEIMNHIAFLIFAGSIHEVISKRTVESTNKLIQIKNRDDQNKYIKDRMGASARSAKYQPLKELAAKLVNAKNFKSRRNAAQTIAPEIIAESKKLHIALSENQAEITITAWLKDMGLPANI